MKRAKFALDDKVIVVPINDNGGKVKLIGKLWRKIKFIIFNRRKMIKLVNSVKAYNKFEE